MKHPFTADFGTVLAALIAGALTVAPALAQPAQDEHGSWNPSPGANSHGLTALISARPLP